MFDDLIKKKKTNKKSLAETLRDVGNVAKESKQDRHNRQHMLNLFLDSEDVLSELYSDICSLGGKCIYCGARQGVAHSTNCTYRTLMLRLQMEIDRHV